MSCNMEWMRASRLTSCLPSWSVWRWKGEGDEMPCCSLKGVSLLMGQGYNYQPINNHVQQWEIEWNSIQTWMETYCLEKEKWENNWWVREGDEIRDEQNRGGETFEQQLDECIRWEWVSLFVHFSYPLHPPENPIFDSTSNDSLVRAHSWLSSVAAHDPRTVIKLFLFDCHHSNYPPSLSLVLYFDLEMRKLDNW